jgi:hypothetical protein
MPNILHLSLYGAAFQVMQSGEKTEEFRAAGGKIEKQVLRQRGGKFDSVKFINGYGHDRPWFIADFNGYEYLQEPTTREYSNGLKVELEAGTLVILLGQVRESGNLSKLKVKKPKPIHV